MLFLLQQLLGVVTIEQARQQLINHATALGFNATSWQDGSIPKTLLFIFAEVYAALGHGITEIAKGGYLDLAEDVWLHMKADSDYDNQVHRAVATQGLVTLTSTSFAPPYSITIDQLTAANADGITFRNKTAGTLSSGGTLELLFEAEAPGSKGNIAPNTLTILKTPLAGVSINNPVQPDTTPWITRDGADAESNAELRTRSRTKWATLGIGPGMAYVHNARQAHESVKRVFVDDTNPQGPGTIDLYLAGDSGEVSATVVQAVDAYLKGVTDGIDRVNTTAALEVFSATAKLVTIAAGVYIVKQYDTPETRLKITESIGSYFKSLPIGGTPLQEGGPGAVRLSGIVGAAVIITGVQNFAITSHQLDVPLLKNEVAVPNLQLTYYPI